MRAALQSFVISAVALVVLAFALPQAARAGVQSVYHGGMYAGSVIVERNQEVKGDLTVMFGDATVEGVVDGNVNVLGGNLYLSPGATITGQVNTLGGDLADSLVPWSGQSGVAVSSSSDYRMLWRIAWDVVAVLFFLIFPLRTRIAVERLEKHPGLSAAVGLLGWVAVVPLAVLLICTILLIPFVVVEAVLLIGATFLGKAALALLVGRRLCEVLVPKTAPTPFVALLVGLALITAAELVPVVGTLVTAFVLLIGLGAAILAFVGDSVIEPPAAVPKSGPPLSGPPMPVA